MPPNTIFMGTELLCSGDTGHCFEDSASALATVTSHCYLKMLNHHGIDPRAILWWICLLHMGFKLTRFIYTAITSIDTYTDSQCYSSWRSICPYVALHSLHSKCAALLFFCMPLQYGSNKLGQLPIWWGHQWMWCENCFHNTFHHRTVLMNGLHIHLLYPCFITVFGVRPTLK
jgi:hypothetical protein